MNSTGQQTPPCATDTVEVARMAKLLHGKTPEELQSLFSAQELLDAGAGPQRPARLAARTILEGALSGRAPALERVK